MSATARALQPHTQHLSTFYHGTSLAEYQSIKHAGLIPGKGKGGDYWATRTPLGSLYSLFADPRAFNRPKSIYLAPEANWALPFAQLAAEVNHSQPIVLEVLADVSLLVPDEQLPGAYRCECVIAPQFIKVVEA